MAEAFLCDYIRTPIGRYGGVLSTVRTDDLGAVPLRALSERNAECDWSELDEVILGCANQAGEDNRNVARNSALLAGLPSSAGGLTVNRLCGSGMDAILAAARAIRSGEGELFIAGGVESMSRAPFVFGKSEQAFSRDTTIYDTTIGWRFVNRVMEQMYGTDSMPETAENVAEEQGISRVDQDQFALRSQQRAESARASGFLAEEITAVQIPQRRGDPLVVDTDEFPRPGTTIEALSALPTPFRKPGTVTAGNASGINDGAAAVVVASERAARQQGLRPLARILGGATAGVEPRVMGIGPVPAVTRLCARLGLAVNDFHVIELNEAFAAQSLAVIRGLKLSDDAECVNPNGGAIALGHPLGASGTRITGAAVNELVRRKGRYALATMCVGVGQGIAIALERC